jgi:hypothetical protein
MAIHLSKDEALEELHYLKETWKTPPFAAPTFCRELEYVDFFIYLLNNLQDAGNNNIVRFVSKHFERGLDTAFSQICRILDRHRTDGSGIYNLMADRKFILRRDKRNYNRKVPGKSPKGLTYHEWESYNNWLAAGNLWNGYIEAHRPDYSVSIPEREDIETPIEVLLRPEYKPLWGMKEANDKAGSPANGPDLDDVVLRPLGFWVEYMKERELMESE